MNGTCGHFYKPLTADIVDLDASTFELGEIWWIFHQPEDKKERQDADGQVDIENPAPRIIVREPAAESRADCGCADRRDSVKSKCEPALLRWKRVGENGLRHGLQSATARALQDPEQDQQGKARCDAAEQ